MAKARSQRGKAPQNGSSPPISRTGKPLHGAAADPAKRGRGPRKGAFNAGRPPDAWKEACRALASRDEILERARAILDDIHHPAWLATWKFVAEQGYGKATPAADAMEEPRKRQVLVIGDQTIEF